jgi:hypothetical protein
MMKDRIGNGLNAGDRVLVALPEAQIFGFVAQMEEGSLIAPVRGGRGLDRAPGRVLVSCVVALPVDPASGMVAQLVRVVDPDKVAEGVPN